MEPISTDATLVGWWIHAAATWALVGLIWVVQVALYPGFARVGGASFVAYHADYTRRMTWVVAPLMAAEIVGAVLAVASPPPFVSSREAWLGLGLAALCWLSTATVQVPLHRRLGQGSDPRTLRLLVRTNWIRTAAWTVRGAGLVALALRAR